MADSEGFQNPECYARALGGCCRQIDREHYVSESILELIFERFGRVSRTVPVKHLAFQDREVLETFGVGKLTSKILCRTHHALLSSFDSAGKAMFVAMDSLNEAGLDPRLPTAVTTINGDGLERWMLKTLCGGLFSGNFLVALGERMKGTCPPLEWLNMLFKRGEFPPGQGLYYMYGEVGRTITVDPIILKLAPLTATDGHAVMGLRLWLFGFEFVLLAANVRPGVPTMFDDASYRPEAFRDVRTGSRIQFDWRGGPKTEKVEVRSLGERRPGAIA